MKDLKQILLDSLKMNTRLILMSNTFSLIILVMLFGIANVLVPSMTMVLLLMLLCLVIAVFVGTKKQIDQITKLYDEIITYNDTSSKRGKKV